VQPAAQPQAAPKREPQAPARPVQAAPAKPPRPARRQPLGHHEVFSLNFIRHETVPLVVRRAFLYLTLGYLVVNLVVLAVLLAGANRSRSDWASLRAGLGRQVLSPDAVSLLRQETGTLRERATEDLNRLGTMTTLQQSRFLVAGRLAALTKTLPPRTWIAGLSGQREGKRLSVRAAYLINPERPYDLPTKAWMDTLRADPVFREGLKLLELGSSSRKMQGDAELFSFELLAEWSP
jgi:hypothetical protein